MWIFEIFMKRTFAIREIGCGVNAAYDARAAAAAKAAASPTFAFDACVAARVLPPLWCPVNFRALPSAASSARGMLLSPPNHRALEWSFVAIK